MPKRTDIDSILIIGAGPIVIGQACEFDYSGAQACKALREEGYRVVLVNSNPATIMTDPDMADSVYIEPVHWQTVARIIEQERPDALLPTMGGQTALNCALDLVREGVLQQYGVRALLRDDALQRWPVDGLDVGRIRHLRIGHDGRRIGIDQYHPVALFPQRLAGLGAGVIELAGLSDHDRARSDDEDAADVGSLGHLLCLGDPSQLRTLVRPGSHVIILGHRLG